MGLLALGIGVGLGIAAARHFPAELEQSFPVVVVVWLLAMVAAYVGGRRFAQSQFQIQWQQQQQEQAQLQEQLQQQAQTLQVFVGDREQVTVAGGGPALAGPPADRSALPGGPFLEVEESVVSEVPRALNRGAVEVVRNDPVDGGRAGVGVVAGAVVNRHPLLPDVDLDSAPDKSRSDDA